MKDIKTLYVVTNPQRLSGSNRSLLELIKNLTPPYVPLVLSTEEGLFTDVCRNLGIKVETIKLGKNLSQPGSIVMKLGIFKFFLIFLFEYVPFFLRARREVKRLFPSIVHTNDPKATILFGPIAKSLQLPLIAHLRGAQPFGRLVSWAFERLPHSIISVSKATAQTLSPLGRTKVKTIYNGLGYLEFGNRSFSWLESLKAEGVLIVSSFASLVPFKGYHHLLDTIWFLNKLGFEKKVSFFCVGDFVKGYEEYQGWLREKQKVLGLKNVTFVGWQDDPYGFYKYSDLVVLPSVDKEELFINGKKVSVFGSEGLPRSVLESMNFGIPVIASDVAGVREQIVNGENGLLTKAGDRFALLKALEELLTSPELRTHLGQNGKEAVRAHFASSEHTTKVKQVYDTVLDIRALRQAVS